MKQKTIDEFFSGVPSTRFSRKVDRKKNYTPDRGVPCLLNFYRNVEYVSLIYRENIYRVLHRSKGNVSKRDVSFSSSSSFPVHGFSFDSRSEYSLIHQEKEMTLYSINDHLCSSSSLHQIPSGIVNLHASKMTRFSDNWRGYISDVQFNGGSLSVSCAVKPDPLVFTFDLEAVDEEEIIPLIVFELKCVKNHMSNISPSAHALAHFSEFVKLAGLSDGKVVYLDSRSGKPIICAEYKPFTGYTLGRPVRSSSSITSLSPNPNDLSQLICGSQNGCLFMWDLRHTQQPVADGCTGSFEVSKIVHLPHFPNRIGCSRILCSTSAGFVYEYGFGNNFMKFWEHTSCNISRFIAERPTPKVDLHDTIPLALFPDGSPNSILVFDVGSPPHVGFQQKGIGEGEKRMETQIVSALTLSHESVTSVRWIPNKEKILVGLSDGKIYVMDLGPDITE